MAIASHERSQRRGEQPLRDRYAAVRHRIATAAQNAGRSPESIVLIAVTKYASIDQVRELIEIGQIDLAESYVQNLVQRAAQIDEYLQRVRQLGGAKAAALPKQVRWHMVGSLQRNKVRKVVELCRLIHSVDTLRLAEEIQAAASRVDEPVEVLVQVNVAGEKSKHGVAPPAARHLVDQIDTMVNLRARGIMCMAPASDPPFESREVFERCRELFEDIKRTGAGGDRFDILSMGMSSDFETAIECGANMVRVGTAIFGQNSAPDGGADAEEL